MTPKAAGSAPSLGLQCLQQYQDLHAELDAAIDAIARNALADFEHSLWQQEMLSTNLRRSLFLLANTAIAPELRRDLTAAGEALRQKAQVYKALVDRAEGTAKLLGGVCSLYQLAPSSSLETRPMLSCEA